MYFSSHPVLVQVGHIRATLRKSSIPRWLEHLDQAPTRATLRTEKDKYYRELLLAKGEIGSLFSESAQSALKVSESANSDPKKKISQALKMYRLLQPESAPVFYKQDALLSLKSKLSKAAPLNPRSFMLALDAATNLLCNDLEEFAVFFNPDSSIPEKTDPERLLHLVNLIFDAFPLRKDPSHVDQFMIDTWPRLKLFLPESIDDGEFADWLRGHLARVIVNQRRGDEMYSFSRDFSFDSFNQKGGSKSVGDQMRHLLTLLKCDPEQIESIGEIFEIFLADCEKIGLKKWTSDKLFDEHLPRGPVPKISQDVSESDILTAKKLLKAAARGRVDLLEFETVDPSTMLHTSPLKREGIDRFEENIFFTDKMIEEEIDLHAAATRLANSPETLEITDLENLISNEKSFIKSAGPAEWDEGWRWKTPSAALFDPRLNRYVRNQTLVDPNLSLASMRQWTCDVRRMCSMSSAGRIYYSRSIVVVGNGQGIYGFGVGFGNTPRESTADAAVKALRNLKFVDYDPTRTLTTPVRGTEYKARLFLRPLRQGKKLRCGRRFLPLFYILGLHNVRARFNHTGWFPRMNAIVRTLSQIQSRKTLANATGKKFADITVPGDHWVHWPDRWFDTIRRTYQNKEQRVKAERRKNLHHKRRNHIVTSPSEIRPGWTKDAWMNPLAKWNRQVGRTRTIARTVKELPVSDHFPTTLISDSAEPLDVLLPETINLS